MVIETLDVERDLFIDGLDINETPRIENEGGKVYIFIRTPTKTIGDQSTSSFLIVIAKDYFITISRTSLEIFEQVKTGKMTLLPNHSSRNLMKILYLVSREFDNSVRRIYKEIKSDRKNISVLR